MKKTSFLLLFFLFLIQSFYGQVSPPPPLPTGWERIYIKNVGSIDLPPTMEVQKGKYKEFVDGVKKKLGVDAQFTAQAKGMNELENEDFDKFARVTVETVFGSPGDFKKLNFNLAEITKADIAELDTILKQQFEQSLSGIGLIDWYPLKVEKVNGVSCIHYSFKIWPLNILVHMYCFQNNDRMHNLTLSYRLSEADYWEADFATILKSFRITNIR